MDRNFLCRETGGSLWMNEPSAFIPSFDFVGSGYSQMYIPSAGWFDSCSWHDPSVFQISYPVTGVLGGVCW